MWYYNCTTHSRRLDRATRQTSRYSPGDFSKRKCTCQKLRPSSPRSQTPLQYLTIARVGRCGEIKSLGCLQTWWQPRTGKLGSAPSASLDVRAQNLSNSDSGGFVFTDPEILLPRLREPLDTENDKRASNKVSKEPRRSVESFSYYFNAWQAVMAGQDLLHGVEVL